MAGSLYAGACSWHIIIIIVVPFIVLYKSKTIVGQLGPKASASQVVFANIQGHQDYKNEEGRSTEYPGGTVLANINRLVALTYFSHAVGIIGQLILQVQILFR